MSATPERVDSPSKGYAWVFENHEQEVAKGVTEIEGNIPVELSGTALRNGPGVVRIGTDAFNLFDGHGQVAGLSFSQGAVVLRVKNVQTPDFVAEMQAGRQLKRRAFSNKPGRWSNLFDLNLGSTAYHNAYAWGGNVVAANDPGHFMLDGKTLETLGPVPWTQAGKNNLGPLPRHDVQNDRLVTYQHTPGIKDNVTFYEFDPSWAVVKKSGPHKLPKGGMFMHDIAVTPRYYVLTHWASLALGTALFGARPVADAIEFDPRTDGAFILVPRDGQGALQYLPAPGNLMFHLFNAFDDENGNVVVDCVSYDRRIDFAGAYPDDLRAALGKPVTKAPEPRVLRSVLDPRAGTVSTERVVDVAAEAPEVNHAYHGKRHRYGYASARTSTGDEIDCAYWWFHGLAKIDFDERKATTWDAGRTEFVSAPAFAQRPGATDEDDGWVLSWVTEPGAKRTDVVILDARDLSLVARVKLPLELGMTSHVEFAPNVLLSV
jgi:all-trans-8'-apo-beta-carotenal 15,15'-oxygenase